MKTDVLAGLNEVQREAAEHVAGPLLIVAGPGSGKTRVITHRIAYLVDVCGVSPHRVAAVTFTNKAAREMRERLGGLLGQRAERLTASTFHSFCARALRRDGGRIGLDRDYSIYDDADQVALLKRAMGDARVDPNQWGVRAIQSAISRAKSQLIDVHGYAEAADSYFEEIVHRVYERYDEMLARAGAVDFDDLLLRTHLLLDRFPDVAEMYRRRYVHLMVDEFQDTDVAQYAVARSIASGYDNLCVVGDPDQAIYSWRNADIRNIMSFRRDFPGARVIALEQNYRSTKAILGAAQGVIGRNSQRVEMELWTDNQDGLPVVVAEGYDAEDEARKVLREIQSLTDAEGFRPGEIAVMYRVNAQSRELEEACMRYGVPYQLIGGLRFYQRQEVKDAVAYLRLLANPADDVSLARVVNVPPRGIGRRTLDELTRMARDAGTSMWEQIGLLAAGDAPGASIAARSAKALAAFREMMLSLSAAAGGVDLVAQIDLVMERTGYREYAAGLERGDERVQNLDELRSSASDFLHVDTEGDLSPLTVFLESVALVADADSLEERGEAITLITLHQAKGLEFPVVFMVGMEEGLLPHSRSLDDEDQLEEERRLCYVGMTRARRRLYLMRAFRRGFRGEFGPSMPSRFLSDVPARLRVGEGMVGRVAGARPGPAGEGRGTDRRPRRAAAESTRDRGRPARTAPVRDDAAPRTERIERVRPRPAPAARAARRGAGDGDGGDGSDLSTGDRVVHDAFGEGVVVAVRATPTDLEVTVAFRDGHGVKRLLMSFAPLRRA